MIELRPLDIAEFLDNEETIDEYLRLSFEDANPDVFLSALCDVSRAKGRIQMSCLHTHFRGKILMNVSKLAESMPDSNIDSNEE